MEGLGTAVLEAMALGGIPIVAYDIPPVREVTDDGRHARLARVGDSLAFAEAVLELLAEGAGGADTKTWATERHAIEKVARQVEELLEQVAKS